MRLTINWNDPILPASEILSINLDDLDSFYTAASETDRLNLFFILLATCHAQAADPEKAAHLCFLMAYYLFITLTPPGAQQLALSYIRRAMELNPKEEYKTWLTLIEKGN